MTLEIKTENFKVTLQNLKNNEVSIEETIVVMTKLLEVLGEDPKNFLDSINDKIFPV